MTNEQLLGVGLLALGGGLLLWSVWPQLAKWLVKPSPEKKEPVAEFDPVYDWAELHMKVAELSQMLNSNPAAKAKLNELGQLLYDPKNWETQDEPA